MNRSTPIHTLASLTFALTTLGMACWTVADEHAAPLSEEAVRAASVKYLAALQSGDADALQSFWTADGVYVDANGESSNARDLIAQEFAGDVVVQDDSPAQEDSITGTIRVLAVGAALQEGVVQAADGEGQVRFTAQWVLQEGRWRLDYLRETQSAAAVHETQLEDLECLLGRWETATESGVTATMTVRWNENKNFLLRTLDATLAGGSQLQVEQRIGWDPRSKSIRSWAFRSDGGFGQATWRRHGEAWAVESTETLPSGETSKSARIWMPEGSDTLWFKLHSGVVAGREVEDLILKFTRDKSSQ